jgi:hypothetical protein
MDISCLSLSWRTGNDMPGPLAAPRRNIHANGARTLLPLGKRCCGVFGLQANTPGVKNM